MVHYPLGGGGRPWAARLVNRAVGVVVARPDLDLVAVARRQVIERERGDAGERIFVAPFCFIGRVVGGESHAGVGPPDPVVGGCLLGGLPVDDELPRFVAVEGEGWD